jgi:DNA-binding transcriptional MerR regulator
VSEQEASLTVEELADRVGVSVRTVRYYITEGLLPGPGSRGKSAAYGEEHLRRLQLIRQLADQRVPIAEIRARLAGLSLAEVRALLQETTERTERLEKAELSGSPSDQIRAILDRIRRPLPERRGIAESDAGWAPPSSVAPPSVRRERLRPSGPATPTGEARWSDSVFRDSAPPASPPPPAALAKASPTSWERIELAPGVELHVRADVRHAQRGLVERLLQVVERWRSGS